MVQVAGVPASAGPFAQPTLVSGSPLQGGVLSYLGAPAATNVVVEEVITRDAANGEVQAPKGRTGQRGSITTDLFSALDKNNDGFLSYDEFRAGLKGGTIQGGGVS